MATRIPLLRPNVDAHSLSLQIPVSEWLILNFRSKRSRSHYSAAMLTVKKQGRLLICDLYGEPGREPTLALYILSFSEAADGDIADFDDDFLLALARKLGLEKYKGRAVETYFVGRE